MDWRGKVVVITGGSSGVGAAAAKLAAERGANVLVNYNASEADARAVVESCEALGVEAGAVKANVADDADCRAMATAAMDRWGRIDGLICSAGKTKFVDHRNLDGLSMDDFLDIYAVNVVGAYQATRAVAGAMKATGGGITFISSIAGLGGGGSSIAYAASKGALNTMTLSLAKALGPEIRVNTVCPGFIQGRWLREGLGDETYEASLAGQVRNTVLKRAGTPEEMAAAALWLLEAEGVTGEIIRVDSGMMLR